PPPQRPWSGALAGTCLPTASRPTLAHAHGACLQRCGACNNLSVPRWCSAVFVSLTNAGTEPLTSRCAPRSRDLSAHAVAPTRRVWTPGAHVWYKTSTWDGFPQTVPGGGA